MKAMILAAGLGTRLKPITDHIPKALVEVEGVSILERVINKLKKQGFNHIIVNVHHFSDKVENFLRSKDFGVEIDISDESEELLDTGGGILKASPMLFKRDDDPVLVHNVDILSNADLGLLTKKAELGTLLLVSDRESNRKLIFNKEMHLKGWHDLKNDLFRPKEIQETINDIHFQEKELNLKELAFSGIYVINKKSVEEMGRLMGEGKYSVMDYFLHPSRKESIRGFEDERLKMIDIGKPATLSQAYKFI